MSQKSVFSRLKTTIQDRHISDEGIREQSRMENEEKRLIEIMQIFYDVMVKKTILRAIFPFFRKTKLFRWKNFNDVRARNPVESERAQVNISAEASRTVSFELLPFGAALSLFSVFPEYCPLLCTVCSLRRYSKTRNFNFESDASRKLQ